MKQLDVDVSPPAFFIKLTLMKTTLGPVIMMYIIRDMNYCLVRILVK